MPAELGIGIAGVVQSSGQSGSIDLFSTLETSDRSPSGSASFHALALEGEELNACSEPGFQNRQGARLR
jgi:hypothetical protein